MLLPGFGIAGKLGDTYIKVTTSRPVLTCAEKFLWFVTAVQSYVRTRANRGMWRVRGALALCLGLMERTVVLTFYSDFEIWSFPTLGNVKLTTEAAKRSCVDGYLTLGLMPNCCPTFSLLCQCFYPGGTISQAEV